VSLEHWSELNVVLFFDSNDSSDDFCLLDSWPAAAPLDCSISRSETKLLEVRFGFLDSSRSLAILPLNIARGVGASPHCDHQNEQGR
jgi:hypothetical protein